MARTPEAPGRPRRRRGLLFVLLALSILGALWSLAGGIAALAAWQAGLLGEDRRQSGLAPGGAEDQAIRRRLGLARRLDPTNPRYPEQLARHLETVAGHPSAGPAGHRRLREEARALYLAGAARRPTWPYGLTALLDADYRLGRVGPEFTRCFARAADLGGSETVARQDLVALGLTGWPVLGPDARQLVLALVRHELTLDPRRQLEVALRLGRGAVVEPLIAADPELVRLYGDLGAAARGAP